MNVREIIVDKECYISHEVILVENNNIEVNYL